MPRWLRPTRSRPDGLPAGHLRPGTDEYERLVAGELAHYSQVFASEAAEATLVQPVPASWVEIEHRSAARVAERSGGSLHEHVTRRLEASPDPRLLSLGSGPGGLELELLGAVPRSRALCLDLNETLLTLGRERARELGLDARFEAADLNTVELPPAAFDVVLCHASLHHVLELEHLAGEIRRSLRADGRLVVHDVVADRGYRMWPETRPVVEALFRSLPERYRVNHTAYGEPRVDDAIWEADTSADSMECIRSADVVPVLDATFEREAFVPLHALCRRFFDTMYGPNFDVARPLDASFLEWVWQLDADALDSRRLRPETIFAVYR